MTAATQEENMAVTYSYKVANGVPTKVLTVGDSKLDGECTVPLLVLIPGNPGIIDYYEEFLKEVYRVCSGAVHVCGVSHGGHCEVADALSSQDISLNSDLYGLEGQIQHKLCFIDENIPAGRPIFLAAHSIGAYMVLQIMEKRPQMHVIRSILLFPVFERLSETPSARNLFGRPTLLKAGLWIADRLLTMVPELLKTFFLNYYFYDLPSKYRTLAQQATLVLLMPNVFRLVFLLAFQELDQVRERDNQALKRHLPCLTFYYGSSDSWCPTQFYAEMKEAFPSGDLHMCMQNLKHAFVLGETSTLSTFVARKVKDSLR